MEKRFINIKDLSDYLGVSKHTIKSWVYQDRLPYRKIGRVIRFDIREIEKALNRKERQSKHFV